MFNSCRPHHKKGNPIGVSFFVFYGFSTEIEGESRVARAKRFAFDKVIKQDGVRQRTPLITAGRGRAAKGAIPVDLMGAYMVREIGCWVSISTHNIRKEGGHVRVELK